MKKLLFILIFVFIFSLCGCKQAEKIQEIIEKLKDGTIYN